MQIQIVEAERDSLLFHWKHPNTSEIEIYRFMRALFGLTCSPFLLGGVINQHLNTWKNRFPEIVEELRDGMYIDLMTGGSNISETEQKKSTAIKVFEDAKLYLLQRLSAS